MSKRPNSGARRSLLLCLFILGLITAVVVLPYQFGTSAAPQERAGLFARTTSQEEAYPNFDIREDKIKEDFDVAAGYRSAAGTTAARVAETRDGFVRGEEALRQHIPQLKIEYNNDLRIPEVIGPDYTVAKTFLTAPTVPAGRKHAGVLIDFLKENSLLVGTSAQQIDSLKVFADYTNPDGNLSFVELEQHINGIPVFRGGVKAGFTQSGQMIRVINNLAPGLDYSTVSTDFGDASEAVRCCPAGWLSAQGD